MKRRIVIAAALLVNVAAAAAAQPSRGWSTAAVELSGGGGDLRSVRVAQHRGYDRVVFEFEGNLPIKSTVRFANPPFYLGESDDVVKVNGKAFIEAIFTPSRAHDPETGRLTVKEPAKNLRLPSIRQTKRIYDHEGQVIYILGLIARKQFRVQTISNPTRLVVDVRH